MKYVVFFNIIEFRGSIKLDLDLVVNFIVVVVVEEEVVVIVVVVVVVLVAE